jgi:hypothetical protein
MSRAELISDLIANTFVQAQHKSSAASALPPGKGLLNDCLTGKEMEAYEHVFGNPAFAFVVLQEYEKEIGEKFNLSAVDISTRDLDMYERVTKNKWHSKEIKMSTPKSGTSNKYTPDTKRDATATAILEEKLRTERAIQDNLDLVDRFADVITSDAKRLLEDEVLALESKGALGYIQALSQSNQCRLLGCWVELEDGICDKNIHHLRQVQKVIDKCMEDLKPLGVFTNAQWELWRDTQEREQKEIDSFAADLGCESLDELCAKHEKFVERKMQHFAALAEKAAAYAGYETAANVAAGAGALAASYGVLGVTANLTGWMMFSMGAGVGAPVLAGGLAIGLGFAFTSQYFCYSKELAEDRAEAVAGGCDATEVVAGKGMKIIDKHCIAYKSLTKAMCACKVHKSSLEKLRADAKDRIVLELSD